jgi:multiple sugar transport system substrate-binding protein
MQRRDLLKAMAAFGVYSMIPAIARGQMWPANMMA